jgi:hypothetical protein
MSSARQAVHRVESFTGFGNRPDLTPSHQQDLPTGITVRTFRNRMNPISGIVNCITNLPKEISDLRPMRFLLQCVVSMVCSAPETDDALCCTTTSIDCVASASVRACKKAVGGGGLGKFSLALFGRR